MKGCSIRDIRRAETAATLASASARRAIAEHGTPVLLLDTERVRTQYRRLTAALPFVSFHYAVKALSHPAVIAALDDEGCGFDVATAAELALLPGVDRHRIIHTHPVKKPAEIAEAIASGVRVFVIDNEAEMAKFADVPSDVRLLIRLSYRSPQAKSDLSAKFGVGPFEAARLVEHAQRLGIGVSGFSFHVGSQLDDPGRFAAAITATFRLMDRIEAALGVRFDTLDIGGGFPVAYDGVVASLEELADVIRPVLAPRADRLHIIAEPGRIIAAEAMTLVTSVVGVAERETGRWYYLDDGVYGAYSNVIAEELHPLVFCERELTGGDDDATDHRWTTLAGPTCDSSDVIAREVLLPDLGIGDLLVSPAMGAYTVVTATRFNGRDVTPVAVLDRLVVPTPARPSRAPEVPASLLAAVR